MMYSNGHTVEYLSLLNGWQGISIELDILELGLKNGQLDTVTFFLRTKCEGNHLNKNVTDATEERIISKFLFQNLERCGKI